MACSESFIDKVLCDGGVHWKLVAGLLSWLMVGLHCEIHCKLSINDSEVRIVCCSKMLGLQILCCLNIYHHRFSYWSRKHVIFDEGGNKMLENKWCIARWIGCNKSFLTIVFIALILILILILIDWHQWGIDKGRRMREIS